MNKVSENPFKNRISSNTVFLCCVVIFATLYIVSNVMAVKVISLCGYFYFDAGTISFPLAYMLGDVITELWGYKTAKKVIYITLISNIIMVVFTQLGVLLPSPGYMEQTADAYNHIFNYVPRIVVASLVGFLLGELSNAWIMEHIKQKMNGRKLWVRTIGSSMVGYLFDSLPFVLIGFMGTVSTHDLLMMIAFQYVSKLLIEAVCGTPLAYMFIGWIKRHTDYNEQILAHRR